MTATTNGNMRQLLILAALSGCILLLTSCSDPDVKPNAAGNIFGIVIVCVVVCAFLTSGFSRWPFRRSERLKLTCPKCGSTNIISQKMFRPKEEQEAIQDVEEYCTGTKDDIDEATSDTVYFSLKICPNCHHHWEDRSNF